MVDSGSAAQNERVPVYMVCVLDSRSGLLLTLLARLVHTYAYDKQFEIHLVSLAQRYLARDKVR